MTEPTTRRSALIVAAHEYADAKLRRLRAPAHDAEELARVLSDPGVGDFGVDVSLNEPEHLIRRRLTRFFRDRGRDDLLLLHFSCHGLKDEDGRLYFAAADTEVDDLEASAVASEFVNGLMARSLSRRIVLLLDCCYSGAFSAGVTSRAGEGMDLRERFEGRGQAVLTASDAMEYSFEGDRLSGEGSPSVFTSALVDGLSSGAADLDQDGVVSFDELYKHVYDAVRERTPNQTPKKWTFDVQGDLVVARSPRGKVVTPAPLPEELVSATEYPIPHVREGAVRTLADLLHGSDERLALSARLALEQLLEDDSRLVAAAAAEVLGRPAPQPEPLTAVAVPPLAPAAPQGPRPAAPAEPVAPPAPAASASTLPPVVIAGAAAALLAGAFASLLDDESTARALLVEMLAVALVVVATAIGWARRRLSGGLAIGLLTGLAVQTSAAGVGWLGGPPGGVGLVDGSELGWVRLLVPLGGGALVAAAYQISVRSARDSDAGQESGAPPDLVARALAFGGAVACLAAVFLPFRTDEGDRHAIFREGAIDGPWVAVEPFAACAAIILTAAAVGALRRRAALRAGLLLALGTQTALYFASYVLAVERHASGSYGPGGVIGVLGAAAVVAAGVLELHASRALDTAAATPASG